VNLFQAIGNQDLKSAKSIAIEMAQWEDQKGHHIAARELRGSLESSVKRQAFQPVGSEKAASWTVPQGLLEMTGGVRLGDLDLRPQAREMMEKLVKEWGARKLLMQHGIPRRSKIIFFGPPGCGKSITARALGIETKMPTYMVRFDTLIGAYLGQTALRLREIFKFAETTKCVLLFDEIDALGKRRGSPTEVGELDRIVIAMMQELEHAEVQGFVIATSNLQGALDDALWRRFDARLEFPKPTPRELKNFSMRIASGLNLKIPQTLTKQIEKSLSYADVENLVLDVARDEVLSSI